jgi:flavin reductase (DIM6/NTAB) family NADH-FMN oxidoreductase RutF
VPVSRELLLSIFGSFPTGVVIVATLDEKGAPKGLLCQAYVGLSVEPPLMLIAIDKSSRTLAAVQHHRAFVINFLSEAAADVARVFASKSDEKFRDVPWKPSPEAGGAPILFDLSIAFAACRVTQMIEAGDHWIFIASVEAGEVIGGNPLIYWRRTYAAWPEKKAALPAKGTG